MDKQELQRLYDDTTRALDALKLIVRTIPDIEQKLRTFLQSDAVNSELRNFLAVLLVYGGFSLRLAQAEEEILAQVCRAQNAASLPN